MSDSKPKSNCLTLGDISNILTTLIAASALIFSTYQYFSGKKIETGDNRPIIGVIKSTLTYDSLPDNNFKLVPSDVIQNLGARPAYKCKFIVTTIKENRHTYGFKEVDVMLLNVANPMIPGVQIDFNSTPIIAEDSTSYFFKIRISYIDVISNDSFVDSLYYKWDYLKNNDYMKHRQMMGLETKEANAIDDFINFENSKSLN